MSAGLIPVFRKNGEPKFLALRIYDYWDFPKGIVEPGESQLESAKRELLEETGIREIQFTWGEDYLETEMYAKQKIARYYLAEVFNDAVKISHEHHEYRWFTAEELEPLLVDRLKKVLHWGAARSTLGPAFLVDENVSGLAKWLRLVGWDTVTLAFGSRDDEVVMKAFDEGRVILTNDRILSTKLDRELCFFLPQESLFQQFIRVVNKFSLPQKQCWFSRCTICNSFIKPFEKKDFKELRPPEKIEQKYKSGELRLWSCPQCDRFYWKGSHLERIERTLSSLNP